jgi:hypothetical protein
VNARRLPEPYGEYSVYQIIWDNPDQPFDLRIETAHWAFLRRREFITILEPDRSYDHFRLKPRQCFHFQDLSLRLYSTLDLTVSPPTMEVCGIEGVFGQIELEPYLNPMSSPHFYDIEPSIWDRVEDLVAGHHGRYVLRFYEDDNLLDKAMLSRIPPLHLAEWDEAEPYPEKEPLALKVTSTDCRIWNSETERPSDHAILRLHPKTQAEPWLDHSTLRRITSEPISGLVSFPDLSETVEVVVRPRLFGFRLYLKRKERMDDGRFRSRYQPIRQVDYYHLNETALHVFSAPHTRIDIAAGALNVISEESDKQGDWLLDSLACLRPACLDEENEITIRSAGLQDRFSVRWAPLLYDLAVEDEAIALHFDGPEGTAVRLWLRDTSGMVIWTKDVPCKSRETTTRVPLPSERPATGYVTAGYVLTDGSIRPATSQAQIKKGVSLQLPSSWLSEGIGVANLSDLQTAAFQERKT